jgi:hypothetical protein
VLSETEAAGKKQKQCKGLEILGDLGKSSAGKNMSLVDSRQEQHAMQAASEMAFFWF